VLFLNILLELWLSIDNTSANGLTMIPSVDDKFSGQSSMGVQTAHTIQHHGLLGDRNYEGEEFACEGRGWVEQLPSIQREE
jgi:hypothetical protein